MALRGKIAIITGAGTGIGAAIAEYFAKQGALLSIIGRRKAKLEDVARKCEDLSSESVLQTAGDITLNKTRETLVKSTKDKFGKIDILVNNAGVVLLSPVCDQPEEDYDELMNINLKAPIFLTKLVLPHLVETKGSVVNISSISSYMAGTHQFAYATSKVGIDVFTRVLAREIGPMGVRVNSVNPGYVLNTGTLDKNMPDDKDKEEFSINFKQSVPLGRNGTPEDIAKAVAFLVSDNASFITGHRLCVDGGFLQTPNF